MQPYNLHLLTEDWILYCANRPKVDLTKCKVGQKLLTNKGDIVKYMGKSNDETFPHEVKFKNGDRGTRTDEGWAYKNNPLPTDKDIIYIFPMGS